MRFDDTFNTIYEKADYLYNQYYLIESGGIIEKNVDIAEDIENQITPFIQNKQYNKIYTGYNWDFNKQEFIKLNNKNKEYPVYIQIYDHTSYDKPAHTGRAVKNLPEKNTDIVIYISDDCDLEGLLLLILHELQHCREFYAKKNINVVALNKTNQYKSPKISKEVIKYYKKILYILSEAEQHAMLQEVYAYVLRNDNITTVDIRNKKILEISHINEFNNIIGLYKMYFQTKIYDYLKITILFGYYLKKNFNYKNRELTKQYIDDIKNYNEEIDIKMVISINNYINELFQKYKNKVYRVIYKAINDKKK